MTERQVISGVAHDFHIVIHEGPANLSQIHLPYGGPGRLEREIDKIEIQLGHPSNLADDIPTRMIHGPDQHNAQTSSLRPSGSKAANHARESSRRICSRWD